MVIAFKPTTQMSALSRFYSFTVNRVAKMSSPNFSYQDAIQKLNCLQSNKATLEQIRRDIKTGKKCTNLENMENYLLRTGVSLDQLDQLSVIHVAGTKGKGSTSAMCESILRAHGMRTGLYTSPHLVAVRERIRLGGVVIPARDFARHFHEVYDMLDRTKAYEGDMPKYFAFLTVMAFHVFLKEKVDVAVVEVGIGGVVDYTNVLRKVPVVGITSLGLDHTSILGTTIEEIAAAKAGIMKPGCEAYTVEQVPAAMDVLRQYAETVQCPLHKVPDYKSYSFPKGSYSILPADVKVYQINASLAIQLAHAWMKQSKLTFNTRNVTKKEALSGNKQNGFTDIEPPFKTEIKNGRQDEMVATLPKETLVGLRECKWPGRYHVIRSDYATFYMDGAHTGESMEVCAKWFLDNNRHQEKILIFSATGDRDAEILLKPLRNITFNTIFFVLPTAFKELNDKNDNYAVTERKDQLAKCFKYSEIWKELCSSHINLIVLECVSDALINIKRESNQCNSSVLITGSLHLVGAALSILDPNLSKD